MLKTKLLFKVIPSGQNRQKKTV